MARALHRLGLLSARRKWIVLAVWIVGIAVLATMAKTFGSNTSNNLDLPGTNSQAATNLLATRFPPQQNGGNPLIFHTQTGKVTDAKNKQAVEAAYKQVKTLPHVASVVDPFSQQGASQISKDKKTAFISILLDVGGSELTQDIAESVLQAGDPGLKAGMEVAVGGSVGTELSEPDTGSSDVIGLIAAAIILAFTFGTLVAMGLPLVSAVLGLIAGLSLITVLGHGVTVPTIAPTLATMIGLGVGIDYALFLVTRHRDNRRQGMEMHESIAMAVATSGSAIVFAGTTVVIALLALLVAGIPLVTSLGYSSAVAVVTAVLAALTLLPAVMAIVGKHIESARLPTALRPSPKDVDRGFWGGWARRSDQAAVVGDPRRARPVDPADRPVPLAEPRPGGHRRHAEVDHRAPGLRPAVGGLRRRLQRPAPRRGRPREPGEAEQRVHEPVHAGAEPAEAARAGAEVGEDPAAAATGAGELAHGAEQPAHRAAEAARTAAEQLGGAAGGARASGESGQAGARADPGLREQARGRAGGAEQTDRRSGRAGEEGRQRRGEDDARS